MAWSAGLLGAAAGHAGVGPEHGRGLHGAPPGGSQFSTLGMASSFSEQELAAERIRTQMLQQQLHLQQLQQLQQAHDAGMAGGTGGLGLQYGDFSNLASGPKSGLDRGLQAATEVYSASYGSMSRSYAGSLPESSHTMTDFGQVTFLAFYLAV